MHVCTCTWERQRQRDKRYEGRGKITWGKRKGMRVPGEKKKQAMEEQIRMECSLHEWECCNEAHCFIC